MSHRPQCILDVRPDLCAIVCAWCPDKGAGELWAAERGYGVSHGVCHACMRREFPIEWEATRAKLEGRAPCYVLGEHMLANGRRYIVTDTGAPYQAGEYPSGGYLVRMHLGNGAWGYLDNSPSSQAVADFLKTAARLPRLSAMQRGEAVSSPIV